MSMILQTAIRDCIEALEAEAAVWHMGGRNDLADPMKNKANKLKAALEKHAIYVVNKRKVAAAIKK